MTEAEGPKSSWQSWVRSAERDHSPSADPLSEPAEDDADLDVVLAWGEVDEGGSTIDDDDRLDIPDILDDLDDADVVADDEEEDGEFGELLPSVPLLPSIAGRVEALSGVLRSISHRVDSLSAATDVYRSTTVDRIDEFTETVLEQGRRSDQSLDEYRRTTERTIGELRRRVAEQGDVAGKLLARVEEVATDVASLVANPAAASPGGGARPDSAVDEHLHGLEAGQQEVHRALGQLRELVEVVVDTMPASAEGSGADLRPAVAAMQTSIDELAKRLDRPAASAAGALDPALVGDIADAVVARLDLDALAALVAEHLSSSFEVVADPDQSSPAAPSEAPASAGRGRRRR